MREKTRRVVAKIWLDNGNELGFEDYITFFIARSFYEKKGRVKHSAKNNDGPEWDKWQDETKK